MSYWRIPFMLAAVINLIAGIWAGLIRMGWDMPLTPVAVHHGAIMVGGFLATLIALEKAIPLKRNLALAVPVISALSLLMAVPGYYQVGLYFLISGSVGLFIIQAYYLNLYPRDLSILLMLVGAGCLMVGNAMLIKTQFYPASFPWWMGFLLFTITAERIELSKFLPVSSNAKYLLLSFLTVFLLGLLIPFHGAGKYFSATAMIGIAVWMLKHDVMRIGLKKAGLTKFSSVALLIANSWLIINGLLLVFMPDGPYSYDILVHSFFIGYTFAMIFAHGPIILPGVLGITAKPFHSILYGWLFLVQGSLLLRLLADSILSMEWRRISGILTGVGILLYFITLIVLVTRERQHAKAR
ncbi:MAG: hypothetical protein ABL895_07110 [Cyclobacteriaceae bacterium]